MEGLIILLLLAVLAVPVLLLIALVSISGLKRRVADLETTVSRLQVGEGVFRESVPDVVAATQDAARHVSPGPEEALEPAQPVSTWTAPAPEFNEPAPADPVAAEAPKPASPPPLPVASAPVADAWREPPPPRAPAAPGFIEVALRAVKRWFTVGNVPVKIGMLVSFVGVAALLKYANDQGWLTLPIELRLAGITVAALAALGFAWRKRESNRAFALSLQGGAIGILLLTVFAAFKLYGLMPVTAAFALSVVLVAGAGVLAVAQNAKALAVFAILAGFLAPIWLSTGSGNHVALFSYYALLNVAIFCIAWWRSWRVLNLLGFAFTFGIGTLWGVLDYRPEKLASTQPFLALFFVLYLFIPVLFARRQPAGRRDFIDGCLVFGTPLVAFALQAGLLRGDRMTLAFCALGLAVVYAGLAWLLQRRQNFTVLAQSHALLAVGFATLAVPLALSAQATASVFALEGAALVWLGLRQQRWLPQVSGVGLQLAAAVAHFIGVDALGYAPVQPFVVNGVFMGGLLIALAGLATAWSFRDAGRRNAATVAYVWGLLWWWFNGVREINNFLPAGTHADALLAFAALTGWIAAEVHRKRPSTALVITTLLGLVSAVPLALLQASDHGQPFADHGLWAWLVYAALGTRSLICLRGSGHRLAGVAQFIWWLVWPLAASLLLSWLGNHFDLAAGWRMAGIALPWLLVAACSQFRWRWLSLPVGESFDVMRTPLQAVLFGVLGLWWVLALMHPGNSAPLPWIPLFNPVELVQLAVLVLAARVSWHGLPPRVRGLAWSLAGFVLITAATLRTVHHWAGVGWDPDVLLSSSVVQTSLTVVWSVLGVLGWVIGSCRGQRMLWLAGAVLMGVVLAKLVLFDRGHLGDLPGIASFIAYGLLCTVVGYLAPAPPKQETGEDA